MPRAMMLAFSDPTSAEDEDAYNAWYSDKHIHDLMNVPGVVSATRYKIVHGIEALPGIGGDPHRYLAVYEVEGDTAEDLQRFADNLKAALENGTADIGPHINMVNIGANFVLPITETVRPTSIAGTAGE